MIVIEEQTNSKSDTCCLVLMIYDQEIEQPLFKTIQKVNAKNKDNINSRIIVPENIQVKLINKARMFVMQLNQKAVNLHWLMRCQKYEFSIREIIQAAISGITSLSQLHSFNIIHGKINPKTCYIFNRTPKSSTKRHTKPEIATMFGVSVVDISRFSARGFSPHQRSQDILYESTTQSLHLKQGYKSDVQSLLYVLIKMATKQQIFNSDRLASQLTTDESVRSWKINDLYLQMLKVIPENLSILIQLYLCMQEFEEYEKPDYSILLKKLWKQKQYQMIRECQNHAENIKSGQVLIDIDDSNQQIFEEDIRLDVRQQQTGFEKYKLFQYDI